MHAGFCEILFCKQNISKKRVTSEEIAKVIFLSYHTTWHVGEIVACFNPPCMTEDLVEGSKYMDQLSLD